MTRHQRIYVSTACIAGPQPLAQRLADYVAKDLRSVELGANVTVGHGEIDGLPATDLRFLVHNYFPPPVDSFVLNLASANIVIREQSIQLVKQALALSARLQAPFYSVHAGFVTDPIGFDGVGFVFPEPDAPDAEAKAQARFNQSVALLLEDVKRLDLKLLVENNVCPAALKGKLLLQKPEEFQQLLASFDSQLLGMLLDFGHLNVSASTWGFDPQRATQTLLPQIDAFHVHQNDGNADKHLPLSSDSWILGVLKATAVNDRPVVIESKFETVAQLAEHANWLSAGLGDSL